MEWSIQDVVREAGVTSRALRHYDAIGLLRPSRVDAGGTRHYDLDALTRLQRILLLRELGLGLPANTPSLGSFIGANYRHLLDAPGIVVPAWVLLVVTVMAFQWTGQGVIAAMEEA